MLLIGCSNDIATSPDWESMEFCTDDHIIYVGNDMTNWGPAIVTIRDGDRLMGDGYIITFLFGDKYGKLGSVKIENTLSEKYHIERLIECE